MRALAVGIAAYWRARAAGELALAVRSGAVQFQRWQSDESAAEVLRAWVTLSTKRAALACRACVCREMP
jgi:hypothetical protein